MWSRADGTELSPRRFSVGADGALRVALVEVEDEGEYVCRVINMYGDSNVTRFVTVYGEWGFWVGDQGRWLTVSRRSKLLKCLGLAKIVSGTLPHVHVWLAEFVSG